MNMMLCVLLSLNVTMQEGLRSFICYMFLVFLLIYIWFHSSGLIKMMIVMMMFMMMMMLVPLDHLS